MPYLSFYLDNIDRDKNEVHILFWNRDGKTEDQSGYKDCVFHEFCRFQDDDAPKPFKISSFLKFKSYAENVIKNEKPDRLIVLHSLPGALLRGILKKSYKNKYIFDYRDYTYENFPPYKSIINSLVKNSLLTFVSSDAYRKYLPSDCKDKIYTSHNILVDSLDHRDEKTNFGIRSDKIRIAFWGMIRQEELNKTIIKKISSDARFELHYYGREQQTALDLKKYCAENSVSNVFFHGEYSAEDRYMFVRQTDLIHNIYFDKNSMLAMGNKYYDGIIFKIPQLCMKNSYMGISAAHNGVGYECDPYSDTFTQDIYEYYNGINQKEFDASADKRLKEVMDEYNGGKNVISGIFG